jgi:arabinose-5-phosphate isomerase
MITVASPADQASADARAVELAREVLRIESAAVAEIAQRVGASFGEAVRIIMNCGGRVVVSGVGKSGHVARKIASTLASTGTPAFFVHAADAR